jgi:hypothetical protein
MRALWLSLLSLVITVSIAPSVWAHPGHGPVDEGWLHWATSPMHLFQLSLPLAIVLLAATWISRRIRLGRAA